MTVHDFGFRLVRFPRNFAFFVTLILPGSSKAIAAVPVQEYSATAFSGQTLICARSYAT